MCKGPVAMGLECLKPRQETSVEPELGAHHIL